MEGERVDGGPATTSSVAEQEAYLRGWEDCLNGADDTYDEYFKLRVERIMEHWLLETNTTWEEWLYAAQSKVGAAGTKSGADAGVQLAGRVGEAEILVLEAGHQVGNLNFEGELYSRGCVEGTF